MSRTATHNLSSGNGLAGPAGSIRPDFIAGLTAAAIVLPQAVSIAGPAPVTYVLSPYDRDRTLLECGWLVTATTAGACAEEWMARSAMVIAHLLSAHQANVIATWRTTIR